MQLPDPRLGEQPGSTLRMALHCLTSKCKQRNVGAPARSQTGVMRRRRAVCEKDSRASGEAHPRALGPPTAEPVAAVARRSTAPSRSARRCSASVAPRSSLRRLASRGTCPSIFLVSIYRARRLWAQSALGRPGANCRAHVAISCGSGGGLERWNGATAKPRVSSAVGRQRNGRLSVTSSRKRKVGFGPKSVTTPRGAHVRYWRRSSLRAGIGRAAVFPPIAVLPDRRDGRGTSYQSRPAFMQQNARR